MKCLVTYRSTVPDRLLLPLLYALDSRYSARCPLSHTAPPLRRALVCTLQFLSDCRQNHKMSSTCGSALAVLLTRCQQSYTAAVRTRQRHPPLLAVRVD